MPAGQRYPHRRLVPTSALALTYLTSLHTHARRPALPAPSPGPDVRPRFNLPHFTSHPCPQASATRTAAWSRRPPLVAELAALSLCETAATYLPPAATLHAFHTCLPPLDAIDSSTALATPSTPDATAVGAAVNGAAVEVSGERAVSGTRAPRRLRRKPTR